MILNDMNGAVTGISLCWNCDNPMPNVQFREKNLDGDWTSHRDEPRSYWSTTKRVKFDKIEKFDVIQFVQLKVTSSLISSL